jgi:hypothetical protein
MKTFFYFLILCLVFISCKKERACNCSVATNLTVQTHAQKAAVVTTINDTVSITLNVGFPLPPIDVPINLPNVLVSPAKDTTYTSSYIYNNTYKINYDKISKKQMKNNCPKSFEETVADGNNMIVPGSYTVTATGSGKKTYTCKIE